METNGLGKGWYAIFGTGARLEREKLKNSLGGIWDRRRCFDCPYPIDIR
jgi:hypothetical protein